MNVSILFEVLLENMHKFLLLKEGMCNGADFFLTC